MCYDPGRASPKNCTDARTGCKVYTKNPSYYPSHSKQYLGGWCSIRYKISGNIEHCPSSVSSRLGGLSYVESKCPANITPINAPNTTATVPKNAKKSNPGTASETMPFMVRRPRACRRRKAKSFCSCRIVDSSRGLSPVTLLIRAKMSPPKCFR
jgi:hypothetical protein